MNFSSFLDFFTASQALTLTTRKSDLQKVSKSTSSCQGSVSMAGWAGAAEAWRMASSSSRALSMSMRGKRFSPFTTGASSGRLPQTLAESQVCTPSSAPIWAKSLAEESGMKGASRMPQMRVASSRLYRTWARRVPLASISLAKAQGMDSSMYLLARWMTLKTSSRALWGAQASMSAS